MKACFYKGNKRKYQAIREQSGERQYLATTGRENLGLQSKEWWRVDWCQPSVSTIPQKAVCSQHHQKWENHRNIFTKCTHQTKADRNTSNKAGCWYKFVFIKMTNLQQNVNWQFCIIIMCSEFLVTDGHFIIINHLSFHWIVVIMQ